MRSTDSGFMARMNFRLSPWKRVRFFQFASLPVCRSPSVLPWTDSWTLTTPPFFRRVYATQPMLVKYIIPNLWIRRFRPDPFPDLALECRFRTILDALPAQPEGPAVPAPGMSASLRTPPCRSSPAGSRPCARRLRSFDPRPPQAVSRRIFRSCSRGRTPSIFLPAVPAARHSRIAPGPALSMVPGFVPASIIGPPGRHVARHCRGQHAGDRPGVTPAPGAGERGISSPVAGWQGRAQTLRRDLHSLPLQRPQTPYPKVRPDD